MTVIQEHLSMCRQFKDFDTQFIPKYRFFQIKKGEMEYEDKKRITVQLIDLSSKIFYDDIKAQESRQRSLHLVRGDTHT